MTEKERTSLMKRICLILLALFLLAGSALGENSRTEFQFIIHQNGTESAVTAEILLRENEILLTSGLFPSYAFSIPGEYEQLISFLSDQKVFDPFSLPDFSSDLMKTAEKMNPEKSEGYFSGDLFDNASVRLRGSFSISMLNSILAAAAETGSAGTNAKGVSESVEAADEIAGLNGVSIQYNLYNEGKYLIVNGLEKEKTVFTVSLDFTDPSTVKSILGYASEGSNYYWVSDLSVVSEKEMHFSSALVSDGMKHGYRSVETKPPVLKENWNLQLSDDRKTLSFTGEILPANDKNPLDISGTLSLNEKPELAAKICFRDWQEAFFTASAKTDNSSVNTEGLQILSAEDFSGTGTASLETELNGNIIPLMMKLMLALPEGYREDLLPAGY